VYVINGGTLAVTDYTGAGTTGTLKIYATYIYVDATSTVSAAGRGMPGYSQPSTVVPGDRVPSTPTSLAVTQAPSDEQLLAAWALPRLEPHLDDSPRHPFVRLVDTLTFPPHRLAYALISVLMVGAFSVIPFISTSFVANVGVTESQLPLVFVAGGLLTLATTPLAGRLVDRLGGLAVLRGVVPLSALGMLIVTHLPAVGIGGAATAAAFLMATNSARMVTAMSLITASVEPRRRGGFMSVNSSVQHLASGLGTTIGGLIVEGGAGEPLRHFGTVGILAAALTLTSLWIAPRVRPANQHGA